MTKIDFINSLLNYTAWCVTAPRKAYVHDHYRAMQTTEPTMVKGGSQFLLVFPDALTPAHHGSVYSPTERSSNAWENLNIKNVAEASIYDLRVARTDIGPAAQPILADEWYALSWGWHWTPICQVDKPLNQLITYEQSLRALSGTLRLHARDHIEQSVENSLSAFLPAVAPTSRVVTTAPATHSKESTDSVLRAILRDASALPDQRLSALEELVARGDAKATAFAVDELSKQDLAGPWRNGLILAVEAIQINDVQLREQLLHRLVAIAQKLRTSTEPGIAPVVHSAIRCLASMIPASKVGELQAFLEPPNPVETRLVALQCVVHLFEVKPPTRSASHQELSNRIQQLAMKFLDRDWLVAGEKAAIGQTATQALAAIGDERLKKAIDRVKQLKLAWVTRQVAGKLQSLLDGWRSRPHVSRTAAWQLVNQQLQSLQG